MYYFLLSILKLQEYHDKDTTAQWYSYYQSLNLKLAWARVKQYLPVAKLCQQYPRFIFVNTSFDALAFHVRELRAIVQRNRETELFWSSYGIINGVPVKVHEINVNSAIRHPCVLGVIFSFCYGNITLSKINIPEDKWGMGLKGNAGYDLCCFQEYTH